MPVHKRGALRLTEQLSRPHIPRRPFRTGLLPALCQWLHRVWHRLVRRVH